MLPVCPGGNGANAYWARWPLNPYDIRALIPIIRGAGGVITTWDGGNPSMGGHVVASANPELHQQVLAKLGVKP
ncbi:MAG: hypothetical protein CM15mP120_13400 [Pseudomonadota bacterium]|nr:MAG: hypothetical protein CM15mP120_13400 [Pseudomonadota bacterium]